MSVGRYPSVVVFNQYQIAKSFQFVSGIGHSPCIGSSNHGSSGGFDVYAVVVAPFGNGAEFGYNLSFNRPGKRLLALGRGLNIGVFCC